MKKAICLFCSIFLLILGFIVGCQDDFEKPSGYDISAISTRAGSYEYYYWHDGMKIELSILKDKKFILFDALKQTEVASSLKEKKLDFERVVLSTKIKPLLDRNTTDLELMWTVTGSDALSNESEIIYESPFFLSENNKELGLSHLFYVKLKSEKDLSQLQNVAELNKVNIVGNNEYMPLWYTLSCSKESSGNALDMANYFFETGFFESSQPDFMIDDTPYCVSDTYFANYQWNLRNTGQNGGTTNIDINYCNARSVSQGSSSIIVAVVDQGIQMNHPDLNVHAVSYDSETGTSPSIVYNYHGTATSGMISARTNNNVGVAGVAPNCPAMSISNTLAGTPDSRQKRADAINFAWRNGASVISNSWGSTVQYTIINDAISSALVNGRSGKGCVVVFSSGNDYSSTVGYPANINSDIIAVGSINRYGRRSSFSNYGTALDIVAPGEDVATTTINSGYILSISGTSFACPTVSGVAALILSLNPNLSQKDVKKIIELTAKKVGGYNYTTTSGRPNGTWNDEMGYGLVDAYAAVLATQNWTAAINFINRNVVVDETVFGRTISAQNVTVSNNAKLTLYAKEKINLLPSFSVSSGSKLELKIVE